MAGKNPFFFAQLMEFSYCDCTPIQNAEHKRDWLAILRCGFYAHTELTTNLNHNLKS